MAADDPSTRTKLLTAAIDLIATDGLQGLTHRAVESRAGVSHGLTTYYFKSRDTLIEAVLEYLVNQGIRRNLDLASRPPDWPAGTDPDPQLILAAIDRSLRSFTDDRNLALARYELFLYAARDERLIAQVSKWRQAIIDAVVPLYRSLGVHEPETAARMWIAAVDGIALHQLSAPNAKMAELTLPWLCSLIEPIMELGRRDSQEVVARFLAGHEGSGRLS